MPSTNPTIVLIPGAWHTAEHFTPIETKLTKQAFPTIALTLPSSKSTSAATKSLEKDISFIKATIEPLLACGTEIILLMHSSGSISGSAAINDSMSVTERVKQDQKGGVLGLVFIAAYLLPPHTTIKQMMGTADDEGFPPWMKSGEDVSRPATTAHSFFPPPPPLLTPNFLGQHHPHHQHRNPLLPRPTQSHRPKALGQPHRPLRR